MPGCPGSFYQYLPALIQGPRKHVLIVPCPTAADLLGTITEWIHYELVEVSPICNDTFMLVGVLPTLMYEYFNTPAIVLIPNVNAGSRLHTDPK